MSTTSPRHLSHSSMLKAFLIIGTGQVAKHLSHYFAQLQLPTRHWSRQQPASDLVAHLQNSSHVLLAVKDEAIAEVHRHCELPNLTYVHFSGAKDVAGVFAAHPLMTFGSDLEDLEWYQRVPFVVSPGTTVQQLLPGLHNPSWSLSPAKRMLYHSLCSLAGNSTFLLWRQIMQTFEDELHLPREILLPLLHQTVKNAGKVDGAQFTGPVARSDWTTVRDHLSQLADRPTLNNAYKSYLELAQHSNLSVPEDLL